MKAISGFLFFVSELLTLGGVGRLDSARKAYSAAYAKYKALYDDINTVFETNKLLLVEIGDHTSKAFKELRRAEVLLKRRLDHAGYQTDVGQHPSDHVLEQIGRVNGRYSSALAATAGMTGGGALAIGSWALVSVLGSASTATAISTLSGVAATNATLAWFGGGALAAGGAGMAGGMAVLGGIVMLPLVFLWGFTIHRKSRKLEEGLRDIEQAMTELPDQLDRAKAERMKIREHHKNVCRACDRFVQAVETTYSDLYRYGWLSRLQRSVTAWAGKDYFNEAEVALLKTLEREVDRFLAMFDSQFAQSTAR